MHQFVHIIRHGLSVVAFGNENTREAPFPCKPYKCVQMHPRRSFPPRTKPEHHAMQCTLVKTRLDRLSSVVPFPRSLPTPRLAFSSRLFALFAIFPITLLSPFSPFVS